MAEILTCIHRFLYPIDISCAPDGCGNCALCTNDERNKDCTQYYPIHTSTTPVHTPTPPVEKTAYFFSNFKI